MAACFGEWYCTRFCVAQVLFTCRQQAGLYTWVCSRFGFVQKVIVAVETICYVSHGLTICCD